MSSTLTLPAASGAHFCEVRVDPDTGEVTGGLWALTLWGSFYVALMIVTPIVSGLIGVAQTYLNNVYIGFSTIHDQIDDAAAGAQ